MRVTLVSSRNAAATGVDRYVLQLTSALRSAGLQVDEAPLRRRELRVGPLRVGGRASLWAQRILPRSYAGDVVHALDPAVASRRCDVVTVHDLLPEHFPQWFLADAPARFDWRLAKRRTLAARAIIAASEATRQDIVARWGVPAERITTIHHGIDPAAFRRVDSPSRLAPEGAPTIAIVGDDNPRKNIPLAVEALARLKSRGIEARLVRVGPTRHPALAAAYRARAAEAGVELVEPGYLGDAELVALYSRCAAFAWPSLGEGFGFPPLEAMACGAPVVALDLPVNREVLGPLASYHGNDADAMAEALARVLRAPPARDALVAHARRFSWEESARRHAALYAQLAFGSKA